MNMNNYFDFEVFFPNLLANINKIFKNLSCLERYFKKIPYNLSFLNENLINKIPEWKKIDDYSNHKITYHIYKVLFLTIHDESFLKLNNYKKNVLLWGVFFHDISKRGLPEVIGKDPVHPFNSAYSSLKIFQRLFLILL